MAVKAINNIIDPNYLVSILFVFKAYLYIYNIDLLTLIII